MKKIYFVFSLFLMILGINVAYAGVTVGSTVTDPSSLTAGSTIIIRANSAQDANADPKTYKHFASLADSLVFAITDSVSIDPYVAFVLETAEGKTVSGKPAFYLKNVYNQRYLKYIYVADESYEEDAQGNYTIEMDLTFTDEKAEATPVIITTQVEGCEIMKYDKTSPTESNCMMILAECAEHDNKIVAFNCVYDHPLIASYADWAAWWRITMAVIDESNYEQDLSTLYDKIKDINFLGGTNPGCYEASLVDTYNNAKEEARKLLDGEVVGDNEDFKAAHKALEAAYLALVVGSPAPVREGYFRLFNAMQNSGNAVAYATNDGSLKWKTYDDVVKEEATAVWQIIDRHNGTWLLYNVGTGQYVSGSNGQHWSGSKLYSLGNDSTAKAITFTDLGQSQFNITLTGFSSLHAAGSGNGESVVSYGGGINTASAWYVKAVEEELIPEFEAIGQQNKLNRELEDLYKIASAKYAIGSTYTILTDPETWLVTAADLEEDSLVITSNADHNTLNPGSPDGQGIPALIDGDSLTYWHGAWNNGPDTTQYLQFKLNKAVDMFAVHISRRDNNGNHATDIYFEASNDTTANDWVKVAEITGLPASRDELAYYQSSGIELGGTYQYIRVTWKGPSAFTHFGEFEFQQASLSPDCQNVTMGEVADNLKNELKNASAKLSEGTATTDDITALQEAYNAYVNELADPTELKHKLDSIKGVHDKAATPSMLNAEGTTEFTANQPGVYTDEAKAALKAVIDDVQNYVNTNDPNGTYDKTGVATNLEKLTGALAAFKASAPKLEAADESNDGSWYYITYSQHYFDVTGALQDSTTDGQNLRKGHIYIGGDITNDPLNNASLNVTGKKTLAETITNLDQAKWRFVNMGDTAYAIQNKATGLFIGEKTGGNAGLSMTPVAFKIDDIGYATFVLDGYRYDGAKTNPLHIQTNGQIVVFWNNYDLGGGSCFDIENTNESASGIVKDIYIEQGVKGRLYTKCYPIDLEYVFDEAAEFASTYQIATIDLEKKELTLAGNEDPIPAGQPFFYIAGGTDLGVSQDPIPSDTVNIGVGLTGTTIIARTPATVNGLIGNYYNSTKVAAGFGIVAESEGVPYIGTTDEDQTIGWNSAYINAGLIQNAEQPGEIVVSLSGDLETAIKDAIIDAQTGNVNVYSIDGILIKKNVKVSEATKGLAKGIYIVGNKKIAVQ